MELDMLYPLPPTLLSSLSTTPPSVSGVKPAMALLKEL
eukprot:COSAG02_NODE_8779_length_2449_cov_1.989787_1_plen_37_part_10